jgi:asparagine synthase (glutamine-hydrolysing)
MCGLAGFWTPAGLAADRAAEIVRGMTDRIQSRGPDAEGAWIDPEAGIALGHRRLSIIELSAAGAQPMMSNSGRYVLVYNGEIYNHLEVRAALADAHPLDGYRGHSDTETLLAAFDALGIAEALRRCAGMFALACWDRQERQLILARDRMGEKPLYFGWQGTGPQRSLLFASELKALTCHPAFEGRVDRGAVDGYLARLCVPGTASIWQGIGKVPPGALVRLSASAPPKSEPYWRLEDVIERANRERIEDADEGLELVAERLAAAVRRQLLSDVPLGAFLSGGIDSSLIVALMQEVGGGNSKTFSIGFEEDAYNEAVHARKVAQHLGTDHHELVVSADRARGVIPRLPDIYDEPFADSSQIPTFLVCELARSGVTVALSGDGADELFGGYTRYTKALRAWDKVSSVPGALRRLGGGIAGAAGPAMPAKIARAAEMARAANLPAFYRSFTDHSLGRWRNAGGAHPSLDLAGLSPAEQLMATDQLGYLPDDILVKVDRAAMAVSLETRAPYLDHEVVEASWRLAPALKRDQVAGATVGKLPLRRLLDRYVPRALIERPKAGFGVPLGQWLRGPLRDWADDLLARDRLAAMDLVDPARAVSLWAAHRSGREDHAEAVWALLMLSAWHEKHCARRPSACAA